MTQHKMHIMIVDDQLSNLRIMKQLALGLFDGGDVETFADPAAALEAAKENPPDLVVSDYNMPAWTRGLRRGAPRLPDCSEIPIVIVTIYEDKGFSLRRSRPAQNRLFC